MSEQVIVSYPKELLSQPLWKSCSYVREFLSFPTARCGNAVFLFETFFVCFLIFEIELKPARFFDLLSAREFSSTRKFMMLGLLTFTIFKSDFLRMSRIRRHSRKIDFSFISPKHTFGWTYSSKNSLKSQRFILRPKFKKVWNLHIMAFSRLKIFEISRFFTKTAGA